ncbi:hypothetical protein ACQKTA_10005 [Enterococcus sp. 22-H-5-01]|uniref:hypothetical protein n=1 Tax=Enterococcus sp. 22-H-5-01 TaxID=3418555 RepID=UPI003CFF949E
MGAKQKIIRRLCTILLILLGFLMLYIGYDNWKTEKEFASSAKGSSIGIVHFDKNGVQTVRFPENSYGVALDDPKLKEGQKIKIYYQKSRTYRISRTTKNYHASKDIYGPIVYAIFLFIFVAFNQLFLPTVLKHYFEKKVRLVEE